MNDIVPCWKTTHGIPNK